MSAGLNMQMPNELAQTDDNKAILAKVTKVLTKTMAPQVSELASELIADYSA